MASAERRMRGLAGDEALRFDLQDGRLIAQGVTQTAEAFRADGHEAIGAEITAIFKEILRKGALISDTVEMLFDEAEVSIRRREDD